MIIDNLNESQQRMTNDFTLPCCTLSLAQNYVLTTPIACALIGFGMLAILGVISSNYATTADSQFGWNLFIAGVRRNADISSAPRSINSRNAATAAMTTPTYTLSKGTSITFFFILFHLAGVGEVCYGCMGPTRVLRSTTSRPSLVAIMIGINLTNFVSNHLPTALLRPVPTSLTRSLRMKFEATSGLFVCSATPRNRNWKTF